MSSPCRSSATDAANASTAVSSVRSSARARERFGLLARRDSRAELFELSLFSKRNGDAGSFGEEGAHDRGAERSRSARDDRRLAFEESWFGARTRSLPAAGSLERSRAQKLPPEVRPRPPVVVAANRDHVAGRQRVAEELVRRREVVALAPAEIDGRPRRAGGRELLQPAPQLPLVVGDRAPRAGRVPREAARLRDEPGSVSPRKGERATTPEISGCSRA